MLAYLSDDDLEEVALQIAFQRDLKFSYPSSCIRNYYHSDCSDNCISVFLKEKKDGKEAEQCLIECIFVLLLY